MNQKINYNRLLFLDFETTSLKNPGIVSLGFIFYENGKRIHTDYMIINPEKEIEYGAYKIHGITQEEAEQFYPFPEVWKNIKKYFENSIIISHNNSFDYKRVLLSNLKRYNIEIPQMWALCTLENAKALISKSEIENYKLNTLCDYLNIKFDENKHHGADYDTAPLPKIYNRLLKLSKGNLIIRDRNYNIIQINKEEIND